MDTEAMVEKLASKLGDEELTVLVALMDKVASNAVTHVLTQEQQLDKLASDLASSGFSMEEIQGELQKIAEERVVQDECEKIAQDCVAMGNIIGNTASEVFLSNVRGFVSKHAADDVKEDVKDAVKEVEDEEDEEEAKDEVKDAKEELKDAKEEAKMASHREQLRSLLLQAAKLP